MNKLLTGYLKNKQSTIGEKSYSYFRSGNASGTSMFNISGSRNKDNASNYRKSGINF